MLIRRRKRKKVVKVKAKQEKANMPHKTGIAEKPPIKPEWKMPEPQNIQSPLDLPSPLLPESSSAVPSRFPLQWAPVREDVDYSRHPLSMSFPEFKLAESCFRKSIPQGKATIIAIERVQNPFMWEKYAR
ncbi:PREDICTED: TCDD-inducible poly [ADP-ribose] polymerase-like [Acropora digitifera]|uniref:TCDD-inducible poly [ADP-ribose] polymerase-like n=1 Tax=Acropora digitifera TaxID=70779 RepID=UPI00077B24E5|nr:PREDICTED: TCDD-inducible poly [ADP-ribose] polymerase-like [Acropora digitifera]